MECYRTLDLEAAFLPPVGYGNLWVFFQVLQRLIEKLVRNKKRSSSRSLNAPIGTTLGVPSLRSCCQEYDLGPCQRFLDLIGQFNHVQVLLVR